MTISISLVDDHPLLLSGVARMFELEGDFDVVACGGTAADAIEIVARHLPNVLILDLSLPGDAFEAIAAISSKSDNTKVVAFTASTGIEAAVRALEAGASGYILKGSSSDEVLRGVRAVYGGEVYITQGFASKVISALRNASLRKIAAQAIKLSIREEQIIRLLLRGRTNKEIAVSLGISEKTVKHYMTVLMQKLQARNRLEVVIAAQKMEAESRSDREPAFH